MATKRKSAKKTKKSKKTAARKVKAVKKAVSKKKAPKKPAKKRIIPKKRAAAKKVVKKVVRKKAASGKKQRRTEAEFPVDRPGRRSAEESGDLQGLSNVESADSESVDELLEEGNAFEAGVVGGVEDADEHDEREVHTHEVSEDDVPEEYLDEE
jgi:uncharacterized protein with von Willebrand factor type A (vWA) domain